MTFSAIALGLTRLHPHNRLLYSDQSHRVKFDTRDMVTHFGGKGWAIYVMSETGNIHATSHSVGHRHHSSLLAGANVAGAGEVKVLSGKLVHISNKSGHYAPSVAHFLQVLHVLQKRNVDLHNTKVTFNTAAGQDNYPSVAIFLAALPAKGVDPDYEFTKMMGYLNRIAYPNFVVLAAAKGWRWGTPADFAMGGTAPGGRGVVTMTGAQVPHKEAGNA